MRLFLNIIIILFFAVYILLGFSYITKNLNYQVDNGKKVLNQKFKIITLTIKIKDNMPLKKDLNLQSKYYLQLMNQKASLICILNKLNFKIENFYILELNLSLEIDENFTLVLRPKKNAIRMYHRKNLNYETLIHIGLKNSDAKQILEIFHNFSLGSNEIDNKLQKILVAKKRKFLTIIKAFVIY